MKNRYYYVEVDNKMVFKANNYGNALIMAHFYRLYGVITKKFHEVQLMLHGDGCHSSWAEISWYDGKLCFHKRKHIYP